MTALLEDLPQEELSKIRFGRSRLLKAAGGAVFGVSRAGCSPVNRHTRRPAETPLPVGHLRNAAAVAERSARAADARRVRVSVKAEASAGTFVHLAIGSSSAATGGRLRTRNASARRPPSRIARARRRFSARGFGSRSHGWRGWMAGRPCRHLGHPRRRGSADLALRTQRDLWDRELRRDRSEGGQRE